MVVSISIFNVFGLHQHNQPPRYILVSNINPLAHHINHMLLHPHLRICHHHIILHPPVLLISLRRIIIKANTPIETIIIKKEKTLIIVFIEQEDLIVTKSKTQLIG